MSDQNLRKERQFRAEAGAWRTGRGACKTVSMPASQDDSRLEQLEDEPRLGAVLTEGGELGPLSPELALVDPFLAERARRLLPDPRERPRPVLRPVAAASVPRPTTAQAEKTAPETPPRRRRWRRTVLLAGAILAIGAVSGGFLAGKRATSPGATLGIRSGASTGAHSVPAQQPRPPSSADKAPERPLEVKDERRSRVTWAANVLGVAAQVDRPGVTLVWQRPAGSDRVVVLRSLTARTGSVVVYEGRASNYRDTSPRPCTAYRYTIVNYDRNGHRSTGVPTSVVTDGCT